MVCINSVITIVVDDICNDKYTGVRSKRIEKIVNIIMESSFKDDPNITLISDIQKIFDVMKEKHICVELGIREVIYLFYTKIFPSLKENNIKPSKNNNFDNSDDDSETDEERDFENIITYESIYKFLMYVKEVASILPLKGKKSYAISILYEFNNICEYIQLDRWIKENGGMLKLIEELKKI